MKKYNWITPSKIAQFFYPSDGKIVPCFCCGTNHIRKHGHSNINYPICDECERRIDTHVSQIIKEILEEERYEKDNR